jgi:hypothetical protein
MLPGGVRSGDIFRKGFSIMVENGEFFEIWMNYKSSQWLPTRKETTWKS